MLALQGQSSGRGSLKGQMRRQLKLVGARLQLQMVLLLNSSQDMLFLFFLAYSTNLLDRICAIRAPSAVRSAAILHSYRFFSGWNCTAKMGQSLAYSVETKRSPPLLLEMEVIFQKSIMYLLLAKEDSLSPSQWLKYNIPCLDNLFLRSSSRSSQSADGYQKTMVLTQCSESRIGWMMDSSNREVKQLSNSRPRQVPQMGKTLPFLFSLMAHCRIKLAFFTHLLLICISSSPAPPVKSTPLTFCSVASISSCSPNAKMGTTWAPDIQTYLTQAAEMQVLRNSGVEGSSYSSIWVQIPIIGPWVGMLCASRNSARQIEVCNIIV